MEFGDSDSRRRLARIVWDMSSQRGEDCRQSHESGDSLEYVKPTRRKHVTNGLTMSKVILLSVVVASICSVIASASQVSTIASQAVHRSTSGAEISTHNLSANIEQTRQQQQNITQDRGDNQQGKPRAALSDEREPGLISSSTPETLSTTPLAPPNYSAHSSTLATSSQSTTTPANLVPSTSVSGPSRAGYVKLLSENGGDLSASSSVNIQNSQPLQPAKRGSQLAGGGNRWSQHFGARLRPLTPNGLIDHEAASSSKASASLASDGRGFNRSPALHKQQLAANGQQSGFVGQPVAGNFVDNNEDSKNQEEDDDDSEALLYKMMQQQNFLMNPIFQEQPTPSNQQQLANGGGGGGGNRPEGQAQQRGQAAANGNGQAQQNDDLASSKKVIKLLKSYSHIHQVDDSDDQIRGTYTRLSSYRPSDGQMSSRDQYSSSGNQNSAHNANRRPINGQTNGNRQQHVFVSSRPVTTTSQTREQGVRIAAAQQPHTDASYRRAASAQRGNTYPGADQDGGSSPPLDGNESQDGNESGATNGSGTPAQDEEEFECPNNGIFADVASGCQAYHVCQSGAQVQERFNCPLGTLFNDIILTCDFAHNVQCGKKPGEQAPQPAGGLQNNDATYNRQPSQQYQQQAAPRPRQVSLPAGSYPRPPPQQQQQQSLARPASQGPRQLVIGGGGGGSPYNQHNRQQQQASSQAAALGSYPAVKPLSNTLNDAENDADDDGDSEPLVPAALPPRAASTQQAIGAAAPRLPYKAPPAPPAAAPARPGQLPQQANAYSAPVSIQQQIPHQANRQSAHYSQYPPMQAQQRPPQFYQRPAQLANRYVTEASAPARTYGEPNSQSAEQPTVATPRSPQQQQNHQQTAAAPAVGSGSDHADDQSFNLIINHLTPARGDGQQLRVQQAVRYSKPAQVEQPAQKVTPVYKSQVSAERQQSRRLVAASYPISQHQQQQPPAQVHHQNPEPQSIAVPNQQQQQQQNFQLHQHPGTQRQKLPFNSDQKYESQRRNNQISNNYQQQQQSQHKARTPIGPQHSRAPVTTPAYASETAAATQRSVSHSSNAAPAPSQQPNVNGLVDLTNGQQSSVGSENLNNGLLLIVRHSSGGPTLQFQNGGAPSSAPKSVAYAVDPKLINPNSPVDSQLFPNVQQFVAEHHQHHHQGRAAVGSVTQASTNRVSHVDPATAPQQTGRYPIVAGSLPPMTPPEPPREHDHQQVGGAGEQYGAASDHHHDRQSAAGAIVPAASSVTKSDQTPTQKSVAALEQPEQPASTHQTPAASNKKIQQQQQPASRIKRTKSSKPPAQLPKKLEKRTTSTSTTTTTSTSPISAGTSTTTTASTTNSAQVHAKSDNKRKQQTLSRGN